MEVNYYHILGLEASAEPADIKKAFRTMAKKYHPDVNKSSDANELFRLIYIAYNVLSDPQKKALYDEMYAPGSDSSANESLRDDGFDEWKERARRRADHYARAGYGEFKKQELGIYEFIGSQVAGLIIIAFLFLLGGILLVIGIITLSIGFREGFKPSAVFAGVLVVAIGVGLLRSFVKLSKVLYQTTRDRFNKEKS